jgi:hypothetical protein
MEYHTFIRKHGDAQRMHQPQAYAFKRGEQEKEDLFLCQSSFIICTSLRGICRQLFFLHRKKTLYPTLSHCTPDNLPTL